MKKITPDTRGLTLVELMVVLLLSFIVSAAMYSFYRVEQTSSASQTQVAEIQQNLRSGIESISREMRMAGYDPNDTGGYGIISATSTVFEYSVGICSDGSDSPATGTSCTETYKIELYGEDGGVSKLRILAGGSALADNVENIEFRYLDSSGNVTSNIADIRAVDISMLVRASRASKNYSNTNSYTTASGQTWSGGGDGYRRRMVQTRVRLRNIGL